MSDSLTIYTRIYRLLFESFTKSVKVVLLDEAKYNTIPMQESTGSRLLLKVQF